MDIEQFSRQRMCDLMAQKSYSAYKVAKLSGYSGSTVRNYLHGRSALNPVFLDSFCRIVGISLSEFYEGYE